MRTSIQLKRVGNDAVLLDCRDLEHALCVYSELRALIENGDLDAEELVPAAKTVLVRGEVARDPHTLKKTLTRHKLGTEYKPGLRAGVTETVIPVSYDGDDLVEVARIAGMSVEQIIARHTAARYTVAFTGFSPGFAYLAGGDQQLNVPRRTTPRQRIHAGSVGLADQFSGVYPRSSPGGWQIIGHTETVMWSLDRPQASLLTPGDAVRFVVEDDAIRVSRGDAGSEENGADSAESVGPIEPVESAEPTSGNAVAENSRPALEILEPGLQTVVQDRGRPGFAELGVSASGAADQAALEHANRLVGNDAGAAALELGLGQFRATASTDTVLALAGAPRSGLIRDGQTNREVPQARAFTLAEGETLELTAPHSGRRTMLAVRGGITVALVLGSASRDTLAELGPEPLQAGDTIHRGKSAVQASVSDTRELSPSRGKLPEPGNTTVLRVVSGPRDNWFASEAEYGANSQGMQRFWQQEWRVTASSDRVGVRLSGVPLARNSEYADSELPSEAMVTGAIQVPPDGQPVLFLADRPLTGGYPVIGVVCAEDLSQAAQLPTDARVRFVPYSLTPEPIQNTSNDREIRSVLIANRGEIAVRIARAARELGMRSIAVYADADIDALHVQAADDAYALHGRTPDDTYLSISKILEAARISGAEAIHPGYGFLAESAEFASAVIDAGLIWIGPDPETIELLGDKARARELAKTAGAPLTPGTNTPVRNAAEVTAFADMHGLPIVIKAVHGGGGRGIRVVHDRAAITEAYDAASREAQTAFGQGDCIVEQYLERARHIEVQVLGDRHGRVAVLGTRDCSLQRRNQKLVEEAPAPFLSDELRARIESAAADICAAANYVGAGTLEFLLGADGTLTFLEVNTRLQVEHTITEAITGIDLVHEQFRIASGQPMRVPAEVTENGHAIDFRINAEDPSRGFLPTPGTITRFDVPGGPGVRNDSGYAAGQSVSGEFDSLLAKLVVWGRDRDEAFARARRALAEFTVEGVATLLPFDRFVVEDPAFTARDPDGFAVHTRWIEDECTADFASMLPAESSTATLSTQPAVSATSDTSDTVPEVDRGSITAPFDGTLSEWKVNDGAQVCEGDTVATIEAMKMEVPITSPVSGVFRRVSVGGSTIKNGQIIGQVGQTD